MWRDLAKRAVHLPGASKQALNKACLVRINYILAILLYLDIVMMVGSWASVARKELKM